jgi:dihydropteroate synthase
MPLYPEWHCRDRILRFGERPLVMGILNVTPDSFSDGGCFHDPGQAVRHGLEMVEQGADIIDVGGESTRPGAAAVAPEEEMRRVIPVVEALCGMADCAVSVDTTKPDVARAALRAGAHIVNDVSALADDGMAWVVRESGAGAVLMHMRGTPRTMQQDPRYEDVVQDIRAYLAGRVAALDAGGVRRECLALDPGIGFGKTVEHNLRLLASLDRLAELGLPVVVGLSRKSFLGTLTGRGVEARLAGSLAGVVFSVLHGAHVVRVHDVAESRDAVTVAAALARMREEQDSRVD